MFLMLSVVMFTSFLSSVPIKISLRIVMYLGIYCFMGKEPVTFLSTNLVLPRQCVSPVRFCVIFSPLTALIQASLHKL